MDLLGNAINNLRDLHQLGAKFFLRKLYRRLDSTVRSVTTKHGTFHVRKRDIQVLRSVYGEACYCLKRYPQYDAILSQYHEIIACGKVPIIIDAGANVGLSARFFAESFPRAKVFAIEPDSQNAEICRINVSSTGSVEVIEAAIGSNKGKVKLDYNNGIGDSVRTVRSNDGIELITIEEIVHRESDGRLLIVKVDIEGFEKDLFADNTEWINELPVLIIEPHDWMLPGKSSSTNLQRCMLGQDKELIISGENLIWITRRPDENAALYSE